VVSENQHAITIGIEAICLFNSLPVCFEDKVLSGKGGNQHDEGGFRKVEVCQEEVHDVKCLGWVNKDVCFIPDRFDFTVFTEAAFQGSDRSGAHGEDASAILFPAVDGMCRIR